MERLRNDPAELSSLYHDLLIGVTRFFRDPEAFRVLEDKAIPEVLERVPDGEELRVWVAGCATGEEAYSIAMILFERLTALGRSINVKILASDVHRASLDRASAGIYDDEQLEHVSDERKKRFFTRRQTGWQISQDIRQLIVFAPHNLTRDPPFTKVHLVTCRNVLIYFEAATQQTVLSLFHFGLTTNGILFLGPSESTGAIGPEFATLDEHWKIYRKRREVRLLERRRASSIPPLPVLGPSRTAMHDAQLLRAYDELLDRYIPPSLLVDENRNLVESFGGAERLLRVSARRPTSNVLELAHGDLRTVLEAALQRAFRTGETVRYTGVPVPAGEGRTLVAEPFAVPRAGSYVLVSFRGEAPLSPPVQTIAVDDRHVHTLEIELAFVQGPQGLERSRGGLGIGLSLVWTILELHDGRIEAHSEGPGRGATFVAHLPLRVLARASDTRRRVAIVEDQHDTRTMLRWLLEARGHQVLEASDGGEAIELLGRDPQDVAFVDIGLPGAATTWRASCAASRGPRTCTWWR